MTQITVAARACVVHERKVLLVRDGAEGYWHIPGGLLEVGESLEQCAVRELYEETGCHIEIVDLMSCYEFYAQEWDSHKIEHVFLARLVDDVSEQGGWSDLGEDKSITEQRWFFVDALKNDAVDVRPDYIVGDLLRMLDGGGGSKVYRGYVSHNGGRL